MTTAHILLLDWVKLKHKGQVKKYNGEPYFKHLIAVAGMAGGATNFGYEIGLCHDVLEDTATIANELVAALLKFNYQKEDALYITACVVELTDVFTSKAYPQLSREARKQKEQIRLCTISPGAQTVKYADLIDNMSLVIKHEGQLVEQYLQKKKALLLCMADGDEKLRRQALAVIAAFSA